MRFTLCELRLLGHREALTGLQPAAAAARDAVQPLDAVDRGRELGGDAPERVAPLHDIDGVLHMRPLVILRPDGGGGRGGDGLLHRSASLRAATAILELRSGEEPARRLADRDHNDLADLHLPVALETVRAEDGALAHAVGAGDLGERLALLDLVLREPQPLLGADLLEVRRELVLGTLGQPHRELARRRAETAQLGVQLADLLDRRAGGIGDDLEVRRVLDDHLVRVERLLVVDAEAEPFGMLGDERGGDELRNVMLGLGAQDAALRHQTPEVARRVAPDGLVDLALARVVAGPREVPVTVIPLAQVAQVLARGLGGLDGVAALVDPEVGLDPVAAARADHELPESGRLRGGVGVGVEAALDHREIDEIVGNALSLQDGVHRGQPLRRAREPAAEVLAGVGLEETDVGDDRVVQLDGDVVLGAQLLLGDAGELGEAGLGAARGSGIGKRSSVERDALREQEVAGDRVPAIETDGEAVARTGSGRLGKEAGLLFGLADFLELGSALVDVRLRVLVVGLARVRLVDRMLRPLASARRGQSALVRRLGGGPGRGYSRRHGQLRVGVGGGRRGKDQRGERSWKSGSLEQAITLLRLRVWSPLARKRYRDPRCVSKLGGCRCLTYTSRRTDRDLPGENLREEDRIPRSARELRDAFGRLVASGGEPGNELAHAPAGIGGSLELRDVPTSPDDLDLRAWNVTAEILHARRGKQPILLAPEDEDRCADVPQDFAAQR